MNYLDEHQTMTVSGPDFRQTWLWRQAFETPRSDCIPEEQMFFRTQYLSLRERAASLVSQINADLPDMTVHDISHLDALWDTASLVAEGAVSVNPVEAFVLGASILLHDAGMSVAAYPGGVPAVMATVAWQDAIARAALFAREGGGDSIDPTNPSDAQIKQILPSVLRQLHAERAKALAEQAWLSADGTQTYLIEDSDLRVFYGPTIGQIAHSHWWSVHKIEEQLSGDLGALANKTRNVVDRVKLACLLRVADALHLDSLRAPRFLRTLTRPSGFSSLHWSFQERLARPHVELDAVVFTTGQPFGREEAEAWWLAYETLTAVDRELRDVDLLLQSRDREVLKTRRVKGAGSPELLSRTVQTRDWRPIDARLRATDVPRIVENLGGSKLYGDNPAVALRELIQNAADAIQARRKYQQRPENWGRITVSLEKRGNDYWLLVEDNGIGMSEQVLTGPLLDFGTSFWRSSLAMEAFPGLLASGMDSIGRFGIGFFAVFMLGDVIKVYSRRCDKGNDTGRLLEFSGGTTAHPIIVSAQEGVPIDGGTRVEVRLKEEPSGPSGILSGGYHADMTQSLSMLVGAIAPSLDVATSVSEGNVIHPVASPGDWHHMADTDLIRRVNPGEEVNRSRRHLDSQLMRSIKEPDGTLSGRAFISPTQYSFVRSDSGWITIAGLRANRLRNIQGVLLGETITVARDLARPRVSDEALARWASEQATLICDRVEDEERQAKSAEVVLECGGEVGALKVARWGSEWLNANELESRLCEVGEIVVGFDGEFEYNEDLDDVHPRSFRDHFEQRSDVVTILRHDGSILNANGIRWPKVANSQLASKSSKIAEFVRGRIASVWKGGLSEDTEERVIGTVSGTEISRELTVFYRDDREEPSELGWKL